MSTADGGGASAHAADGNVLDGPGMPVAVDADSTAATDHMTVGNMQSAGDVEGALVSYREAVRVRTAAGTMSTADGAALRTNIGLLLSQRGVSAVWRPAPPAPPVAD